MGISISHPTDRPNFSIVYLRGADGMPGVDIAFSYEIPIGYRDKFKWIVRENEWGPTTGKHLDYLNNRDERLPGGEFERALARALTGAKWATLKGVGS